MDSQDQHLPSTIERTLAPRRNLQTRPLHLLDPNRHHPLHVRSQFLPIQQHVRGFERFGKLHRQQLHHFLVPAEPH
jgi:hypothetical protein